MTRHAIGWSAGFWLTVCAALAVVVAWQLATSFPLAPTVTAAPPSKPALDLDQPPALPRAPDGAAVDDIAARPLFSEDRRPYVAPPDTVETAMPEPSRPALPLELAGTFLTDTDQAALLLISGEAPEWLRKGQLIEGWRIEAIEQDQVLLRKGGTEQVLQLRDDAVVARTARRGGGLPPKQQAPSQQAPGQQAPGDRDDGAQD